MPSPRWKKPCILSKYLLPSHKHVKIIIKHKTATLSHDYSSMLQFFLDKVNGSVHLDYYTDYVVFISLTNSEHPDAMSHKRDILSGCAL